MEKFFEVSSEAHFRTIEEHAQEGYTREKMLLECAANLLELAHRRPNLPDPDFIAPLAATLIALAPNIFSRERSAAAQNDRRKHDSR